jgi:phosphopantothenoylcysteine decarboxylase/phosphopantothenate--cysteine ligase
MKALMNRKILLGVTGGVAAYKAAELVRLLHGANFSVQVAMTEAACQFVGPATFQALSGQPVLTDLWDPRVPNRMAHIELTRQADLMVVAPATADFITKVAQGTADDLLSTTVTARNCPLLLAPAMNREMWSNPANLRNIEQLKRDGVTVVGPASGDQACGEQGLGRMVEPPEILEAILAHYPRQELQGLKVLVTAGPTFEAIDPVRGITNSSSGKMGYAVAAAAAQLGAEVVLVSGPTALESPAACRRVDVVSAAGMLAAVKAELPGTQLFVSVAAVADYTPEVSADHKLKKSDDALTLKLVPTVDILGYVAALPNPPYCVGFAAESQNLEQYAQDKRLRKKIPMIAANQVQEALGRDDNQLIVFDDEGAHPLPRASKEVLAGQLWQHILKNYKKA